MYASFLKISRALHPDIFDQPLKKLLCYHVPRFAPGAAQLLRQRLNREHFKRPQ